ncbi:endo alpha-1,4 polygalactosaminidase [Dactylosporangium sp. AC04546]|uniref:endo alpha-1,4 polygalactosaminidase n=1 Tax=Dactylosporangium sp. AC04546 TaxID=2862460 RepID=UPI001EDF21C5|nr:endo alpha-1,4 polygalactosaminidase [Dactylosporangium sp. AC04546]WVK84582.1 endo alpha-1,4 polygalactosaminidase [Dactylosporangium sp. AC04546]
MTDRGLRIVLCALMLVVAGYAAACTGGGDGRTVPDPSRQAPHTAGVGPSGVDGLGSAPAAPSTSGPPPAAGGWWRPAVGMTWQWQLTGTLDKNVEAEVYDVDGENTSKADVAALKGKGRRVICYVNVGAHEDFRADARNFPESVQGKGLDGWPGEKWLDVRRWDVLEPLLSARFKTCRDKGFDAVEPDNVDGYSNSSGFPLTAADQLTFNRRVADLAHRHGLAVGLKNDVEQARELAPAFDFAVNEECARYDECDTLKVFVDAGKPVFHVEYDGSTGSFCPKVKALRFSSMKKKLDLDAWRETC